MIMDETDSGEENKIGSAAYVLAAAKALGGCRSAHRTAR
jgi:hypothetical protein